MSRLPPNLFDNRIIGIILYFSTPEKPIKADEFVDFWSSLTNEEKLYYKKNCSAELLRLRIAQVAKLINVRLFDKPNSFGTYLEVN